MFLKQSSNGLKFFMSKTKFQTNIKVMFFSNRQTFKQSAPYEPLHLHCYQRQDLLYQQMPLFIADSWLSDLCILQTFALMTSPSYWWIPPNQPIFLTSLSKAPSKPLISPSNDQIISNIKHTTQLLEIVSLSWTKIHSDNLMLPTGAPIRGSVQLPTSLQTGS